MLQLKWSKKCSLRHYVAASTTICRYTPLETNGQSTSKERFVDMSAAGLISLEQSDSTPTENFSCAHRGDIAQVQGL